MDAASPALPDTGGTASALERRLAILDAVINAISEALDLGLMLERALAIVLEITGVDGGGIFLVHERTGELGLTCHHGVSEALVASFLADPGPTLRALTRDPDAPLIVDDLQLHYERHRPAIAAEGIRAYAAIPLSVRGQVLGVLVAHSTTQSRFVLADVGLLVSIGKQIGLAIQHARLYQAEHRAREQTATILEATRTVTSSLRLEDVLTRAARSIAAVLGQRACAVWMLNKAGTAFIPSFRVADRPNAELDRVFAALPSVPVDAAPRLRELVDTGRPVIQTGADFSEAERRVQQLMPFHAYVGVPLVVRERVVGVATVLLFDPDGQVDPENLEAAHAIASSAALALENAQLYEQGHQLAVVEERNRLARELHDSVSHALFSMTLISQALPRLLDRDTARARERIDRLNEIGQGALAEMRALIFQLRPAALKDEGLAQALKKHTAAFQSRESVAVALTITDERRLPEAVEEAIFRVAQEALNNIAKHARASAVDIDLLVGDGAVTLTVRDNGIGFDPARPDTGERRTLGLTSMRERAALLGGGCTVASVPGSGATVRLRLPLNDDARR